MDPTFYYPAFGLFKPLNKVKKERRGVTFYALLTRGKQQEEMYQKWISWVTLPQPYTLRSRIYKSTSLLSSDTKS